MVIYLEGVNGAGKTTLADAVARHIRDTGRFAGIPQTGKPRYVHHGPPGEEAAFTTFLRPLAVNLMARRLKHDEVLVMDRGWCSHMVYEPLLGRHDLLGIAGRRMLERTALACPTFLVLVNPPWEQVETTWRARHEEVTRHGVDLEMTRRAYEKLAYVVVADSDLPLLITGDRTERVVQKIVARIEALNLRSCPWGFLGRWAPGETTLLLGETPNGVDLPFVKRDGCAPWLAERLEEAGERERDLTWANVKLADGSALDPKLVEELRPKRIIALGKPAAKWCQRHGFAHGAAPHPAYWKRFHLDEPYPLSPLLG